ncbi:MAG: HIT domain-containing protein [Rhizobiales bacterium]|nr:HIT domain-containing protein [Hyphomicrobiales bacterium]NRB15757.1 HIT domain-containing protein [Hyphomicrobiales bacterium]
MTIPTQYDEQNIIAKIIRGEIPNYTVYEDDEILSFMDIMPQTNGHLLVVSKTASISLLDADPAALATLIQKVQTIAQAMMGYFKPDGISLRQYNGAAAGQTIFHLHFHLIPVQKDTLIGQHASEMASAETLAMQAADLKQILDAQA